LGRATGAQLVHAGDVVLGSDYAGADCARGRTGPNDGSALGKHERFDLSAALADAGFISHFSVVCNLSHVLGVLHADADYQCSLASGADWRAWRWRFVSS